jgi:putative hydrolase of the HAD superfamily
MACKLLFDKSNKMITHVKTFSFFVMTCFIFQQMLILALMIDKHVKYIGFDADDTLWVNESNFRQLERRFLNLMKPWVPSEIAARRLFETEMQNMDIYGYGVKPFVLSVIETALNVSENKIAQADIGKIIQWGKELLRAPMELLDGVEDCLAWFSKQDYTLVLATKGDSLDQERKLHASGLADYFHQVHVMSDKQPANYRLLFSNIGIQPQEFFMIGNSVKSDVIPLLKLGGKAAHIPFHTTWAHEEVSDHNAWDFPVFDSMQQLLESLEHQM